jgi:hypothetical protein
MFYPAATIKPSMFTFSKPLKMQLPFRANILRLILTLMHRLVIEYHKGAYSAGLDGEVGNHHFQLTLRGQHIPYPKCPVCTGQANRIASLLAV